MQVKVLNASKRALGVPLKFCQCKSKLSFRSSGEFAGGGACFAPAEGDVQCCGFCFAFRRAAQESILLHSLGFWVQSLVVLPYRVLCGTGPALAGEETGELSGCSDACIDSRLEVKMRQAPPREKRPEGALLGACEVQ